MASTYQATSAARYPTSLRWLRSVFSSPFNAFAALCGALIVVLVLAPLVQLLSGAFWADGSLNVAAIDNTLSLPGLGATLLNTAVLIVAGTLFATIVGVSFAWLNECSDAQVGWLTEMLPILPLLIPPIAGTIGWFMLGSERGGFLNEWYKSIVVMFGGARPAQGPFNITSWTGLIMLYTIYLTPHVYLVVAAALRNLDPNLEEASRINGASPWQTLRLVTIPAVRPAVASGAFLAAIYGFGLFSVPVIVGTQARIDVISVRIISLLKGQYPPRLAEAALLGLILVIVIGLAWWAQSRIIRAAHHATIGGRQGGKSRVSLGRWRPLVRFFMFSYVFVCAVLPVVALIIVSMQDFWSPRIDFSGLDLESYRKIFGDTFTVGASLRNSVVLGAVGATLGMFIAALLAYTVSKNGHNAFGQAVDSISKLPGALSHVVLAMAILVFFAGPPFALHGTLAILLIAYVVIYLPQGTVSANSAYSQVGNELIQASLISGAGPGQTFGRIQLPLMAPGLAAGWAFLFVLMAGDITASVILAAINSPVVGFVILDQFESGSYVTLAALGVVISAVSSAVVLTVLTLNRRHSARRNAAVSGV